ncbi:MAG: bile acid:sodium symporter [Alphaproteobacteria bacterium]|nr:bile acid:sodium symporter [Alphaproteobacteria bacterium]
MRKLSRFRPDDFTLAMLATVSLSLLLPVHGMAAQGVGMLGNVAIGLLFFLQGARLSRQAVLAGALHWRLHLIVFAATFVAFPLLGLALRPLSGTLLSPPLYLGVLFLCTLPSTVQASVAFTSIARGNVAAALCSASTSSLLGMVLTPALVGVLVGVQGGPSHDGSALNGVGAIAAQLLVPFVAGQLARGWIGGWVQRHRVRLGWVDRVSVLLMVYGVFSAATLNGLWHTLPAGSLLVLAVVLGALLAAMLGLTAFAARRFGLSREDEIAIVFCGSKKSLITGIPMANALFAGGALGLIVLPLMIFHQLQLMACAALARRYAAAATVAPSPAGGGPRTVALA